VPEKAIVFRLGNGRSLDVSRVMPRTAPNPSTDCISQPTIETRGHHTVCSKSCAKLVPAGPILDPPFSLSQSSFRIPPYDNSAPHGPLACILNNGS
jgi:hypothetical protein